jgi:hypothetical protein
MNTPLRFLPPAICARGLISGAALLLATGCVTSGPGNTPVVMECSTQAGIRSGPALVGQSYGMQMTPIPLDSVQFDAQSTAATVAVQQLYATRTAGDTVRVTARICSCADAPTSIRVRTSFLRRDTAPAESPSAWKLVHLSPRALAYYEEASVSRDVGHYLIEIARQ